MKNKTVATFCGSSPAICWKMKQNGSFAKVFAD